jgi:WD40 repeat protein
VAIHQFDHAGRRDDRAHQLGAALAVAQDGSWLASADSGREARIWDPITDTARHIVTGHTSPVRALVCLRMDPEWLPQATMGKYGIWDITTGAPLTSLRVASSLSHLERGSTFWDVLTRY